MPWKRIGVVGSCFSFSSLAVCLGWACFPSGDPATCPALFVRKGLLWVGAPKVEVVAGGECTTHGRAHFLGALISSGSLPNATLTLEQRSKISTVKK